MTENINKNTKKKTWKIPVYYSMIGEIYVEADSIEEAIEIAKEDETIGLPEDSEYMDGSWGVSDDHDPEFLREYYNNGQKDN